MLRKNTVLTQWYQILKEALIFLSHQYIGNDGKLFSERQDV